MAWRRRDDTLSDAEVERRQQARRAMIGYTSRMAFPNADVAALDDGQLRRLAEAHPDNPVARRLLIHLDGTV